MYYRVYTRNQLRMRHTLFAAAAFAQNQICANLQLNRAENFCQSKLSVKTQQWQSRVVDENYVSISSELVV